MPLVLLPLRVFTAVLLAMLTAMVLAGAAMASVAVGAVGLMVGHRPRSPLALVAPAVSHAWIAHHHAFDGGGRGRGGQKEL